MRSSLRRRRISRARPLLRCRTSGRAHHPRSGPARAGSQSVTRRGSARAARTPVLRGGGAARRCVWDIGACRPRLSEVGGGLEGPLGSRTSVSRLSLPRDFHPRFPGPDFAIVPRKYRASPVRPNRRWSHGVLQEPQGQARQEESPHRGTDPLAPLGPRLVVLARAGKPRTLPLPSGAPTSGRVSPRGVPKLRNLEPR